MGIHRLSGSKNVFIVCRREETQRHESHIICIFVTFVCLCAPYTHAVYIDTRCMLACTYEIHAGGRLQMLALMVDIRVCIRCASNIAASCIFNASAQASPRFPLHRNILQCFMEIVISFTIDAKLQCQLVLTNRMAAIIEFLFRETNGDDKCTVVNRKYPGGCGWFSEVAAADVANGKFWQDWTFAFEISTLIPSENVFCSYLRLSFFNKL